MRILRPLGLLACLPLVLVTSAIGYGLMWLSRRPARPGSLFDTLQQGLTAGRHEAAIRDFGFVPEKYR
jgi:hypothetical protein